MKSGFSSVVTSMNALQAQTESCYRRMEEAETTTRNVIAANIASPHPKTIGPVAAQVSPSPVVSTSNDDEVIDRAPPANVPASPAQYKMNRHLVTVTSVWSEYTQGFHGSPSVKFLEENYGTEWRKDKTESKFYNTHTVFYGEIQEIATKQHMTLEEEGSG